jgi:hypothetical protein
LPHTRTTGALRNQCGLPLAAVIQPLAKQEGALDQAAQQLDSADLVARCSSCYA